MYYCHLETALHRNQGIKVNSQEQDSPQHILWVHIMNLHGGVQEKFFALCWENPMVFRVLPQLLLSTIFSLQTGVTKHCWWKISATKEGSCGRRSVHCSIRDEKKETVWISSGTLQLQESEPLAVLKEKKVVCAYRLEMESPMMVKVGRWWP